MRSKIRKSEIARADSTAHLDDGIPEDPQEAFSEAKSRIRLAGYGFFNRPDTYNGRKYTVTFRRRIGLSAKWNSYPIEVKAGILWHELVHIRQREALGHAKFVSRWLLSPFGRWSLEVPAYRQTIRVYETITRGAFNATEYANNKVISMRKGYKLGRIDYEQYVEETLGIWYKARKKPQV